MVQITIDIPNQNDTDWVVQLLERLHLDYKITNDNSNTDSEKTTLENNQAIIAKGSSMTTTEANEMLDWLKEQRQDRTLPFRV
ncbi:MULTISPECIES: hypothetical protein [unclassified Arcicella]|uniref:hypothetical protein n=1 Tax=unclassified Arcicella TaxID=2644986 RepID=UPI002857E53E|nr:MULTISPECIES: hypothetical protein [unclassified Arcicella]MDR6563391.1 hypothetical protein [Arcicella sp. BE51]MDR6813188.1 hypothetical protein [Arcicella sp. BE140]MDR6824502.1 hypothetical protein [Arcicella sp. BE139]